MKIAGISIVRNVADVIAVNLLHHFDAGIDAMYVVDNGSTDDTPAILERAARRLPLQWVRHDGRFFQREIATELARFAHRDGADWIVAIDGDEFWWTERGNLRTALSGCSAVAIECDVINFVQHRDRVAAEPRGLLTMTRRVGSLQGTLVDAHERVSSSSASFVEVPFPTKWIARATKTIEILHGSHGIAGVDGPRIRSYAIQCLHAPLRAKSVFSDRAHHGALQESISADPEVGWQARRFKHVVDSGAIDAEWAANSYDANGLDVHGTKKPVVVDTRLRDVAAKWVDHELVSDSFATHHWENGRGGRVAIAVMTNTKTLTELRERLRVAELAGALRSLDAAVSRASELETKIARIRRSMPGRIYARVLRLPLVRAIARKVAGLT